ncbi:MAG TPA: porin [Stellaceae bacterium]|nr:porin [Stellaceae bacterium]
MQGRKIGTIALLGGSTAALAMLTGLAGARADDLKVNQQLLSERLDQLAAVGLQPGAGAYLGADQNKAAGAPVTAGSFPRSILIPGTETSIRIGGQITEIIDYWLSGGNPNSSPQSTTVGNNGQVAAAPLRGTAARARSNGIFWQSPRESKLNIETRTPTAFGEARTVMEFDWAGSTVFSPGGADPTSVSDNLAPRIRYAYGTLGGLLAGQATSNFSDPDANSETLDFGSDVGAPGVVRVPQVRYTMPAWWGGSFSVSAETPETDVATPAGNFASDAGVIPTVTTTCSAAVAGVAPTCTSALLTTGRLALNPAKTTAPELTAAYYIPQPWGHFDISGVLRPGLDFNDGHFVSRQFVGFGGHIGMSIRPGWFSPKDTFAFHIEGGDALGRYLNQSGNFSLASNFTPALAGVAGGTGVIVKPTTEWGAQVSYQHWWMDNLRSNISYGINHHDIPAQLVGAAQAGSLNKELMTAHANVIWSPVSFIDIGLEYMWGQRRVVDNQTGTENVLISKFAFKF